MKKDVAMSGVYCLVSKTWGKKRCFMFLQEGKNA